MLSLRALNQCNAGLHPVSHMRNACFWRRAATVKFWFIFLVLTCGPFWFPTVQAVTGAGADAEDTEAETCAYEPFSVVACNFISARQQPSDAAACKKRFPLNTRESSFLPTLDQPFARSGKILLKLLRTSRK